MTSQDIVALLLEASIAILSVFFGLFTVVAALLIDTLADLEKSENERAELREEYTARYQDRDILDPQRQKARDDLRNLTLTVRRYHSRARLLNIGLGLFIFLIVLSSFVAIYSFVLLQGAVSLDQFLSISFYALMISPLLSSLVIILVVRRGRR